MRTCAYMCKVYVYMFIHTHNGDISTLQCSPAVCSFDPEPHRAVNVAIAPLPVTSRCSAASIIGSMESPPPSPTHGAMPAMPPARCLL